MLDSIDHILAALKQFIDSHPGLLIAVIVGSLLLLAAGLVLMPVVIIRLPEDHFLKRRKDPSPEGPVGPEPKPFRLFLLVLRNVLGIVLLPVGVILLALPGPGWLTILAGIALLDFPFKKNLERWVLSRAVVRNAVNGLRAKYDKPPLKFPAQSSDPSRKIN